MREIRAAAEAIGADPDALQSALEKLSAAEDARVRDAAEQVQGLVKAYDRYANKFVYVQENRAERRARERGKRKRG